MENSLNRWIGIIGLAFVSANANAGGFVDQFARMRLQQEIDAGSRQFQPAGMIEWASSHMSFDLMEGTDPVAGKTKGTGVFQQRLDPSNPSDTRVFPQRYFVDSSYASGPDAPVFYYICGEAACEGIGGATEAYAKMFHGFAIALEHRFYGQSQPFPRLTPENLRYLRIEFALSDLVNFELFAQAKWGLRGKWITLGGSYPGALSAYYRLKFPQLVVGALASSGPVQARENFELYDWVVNDRAGPRCAGVMRRVVAILENAMRTNPAQFQAYKKLFQAEEIVDPVDFMYIVADMAASAVQYGMKDQFCGALIASENDPVPAYARAGISAFARLGMKPADDSFQKAMNDNPEVSSGGVGIRQWIYQSCTEFGFFQNAYHDPAQSTRSSMINSAFHQRVCGALFKTPPLNVSKVMNTFYAPLLRPATASRILFSNGSIDPWAMLSISPNLGNATNPNLTTFMIQGAAHCEDLGAPESSDSLSLRQARSLFTGMVSQWLTAPTQAAHIR